MAAPERGTPTGPSRARRHVVSSAGKAPPRRALGSPASSSPRRVSPQPPPRANAVSPVWSHCSTSRCLERSRARAPSGHRLRLVLATNQSTPRRSPHRFFSSGRCAERRSRRHQLACSRVTPSSKRRRRSPITAESRLPSPPDAVPPSCAPGLPPLRAGCFSPPVRPSPPPSSL
jgi:hypothetical protein